MRRERPEAARAAECRPRQFRSSPRLSSILWASFVVVVETSFVICSCAVRVALVTDSTHLHSAVSNSSVDIIYLDRNVAIRNYYGWVMPTSSENGTMLQGDLEMRAHPLRNLTFSGLPVVDLDERSLAQIFSRSGKLSIDSLHLTNLATASFMDDMFVMHETSLNNSIIEILWSNFDGPEGGVGAFLKKHEGSLSQGGGNPPFVLKFSLANNTWCLDNFNTECRLREAIIVQNFQFNRTKVTQGGRTVSTTWSVTNSLVKLVRHRKAVLLGEMNPVMELKKAIVTRSNTIQLAFPMSLKSDNLLCRKFDSTISVNTTIEALTRDLPPTLMIDFQRHNTRCLKVQDALVLRYRDLIIRNLAFSDWWPDLMPFHTAPPGATIVLENLIIEMDTKEPNLLFLGRWVEDIENMPRPADLQGNREPPEKQHLFHWDPEDCEAYKLKSLDCALRGRCSKEAECPLKAIFLEDVAFEVPSSDTLDNRGVRYYVLHTLLKVATFAPNLRLPPIANNTLVSKEAPVSSSGQSGGRRFEAELVLFLVIVVVLIACGYLAYRYVKVYRRRNGVYSIKSLSGAMNDHSKGQSSDPEMPKCRESSGSTGSPASLEHQAYQHAAEELLGSVTIGPLLGMGSFGRVYKGTWNGATVAIKVICGLGGNKAAGLYAKREASLSSDLRHPNIVHTFFQSSRRIHVADESVSEDTDCSLSDVNRSGGTDDQSDHTQNGDGHRTPLTDGPDKEIAQGGYVKVNHVALPPRQSCALSSAGFTDTTMPSDDIHEIWLVQEWCDMGSLEAAISHGLFLSKNGEVNMVAAVDTCLDIVRGMAYLQSRSVIHGDLKSSNVLLNGSLHERKRFSAKVADFGLSRELRKNATHIKTRTTGTLSYMPPELIKDEKLMPASDVYSFAIVMWEIVAGELPLAGVPHPVALKRLLYDDWRPSFPDGILQNYVKLAKDCWDSDPSRRPTFLDVMMRLEEIQQQLLGQQEDGEENV